MSIDASTINAPAADLRVSADNNNTTFICVKPDADRTITVSSALSSGLRFKFILSRPIVARSLTITSGAAEIQAQWRQVNGAGQGGIGGAGPYTSIAFSPTAVPGDSIEMLCDGRCWYAFGNTNAADGIALA